MSKRTIVERRNRYPLSSLTSDGKGILSIHTIMRNITTVISHEFRVIMYRFRMDFAYKRNAMLFIRCYPVFSLVILLHI